MEDADPFRTFLWGWLAGCVMVTIGMLIIIGLVL